MTAGPMAAWSTAWATESLAEGRLAYNDITYSREDAQHHYQATLPPGYAATWAGMQRQQVIKAGVRLAQILTTIWP